MAEQREVGEVGRVTVTVGLIAFAISAILIFLYINLSEPGQRSVLSFIAAAAAAAGGVTAAYYVGAGVRDAARTQRATRSEQREAQQAMLDQRVRADRTRLVFDLASRWGDAALGPARNTMSRLLEHFRQESVGAVERLRIIEEAIDEEAREDRELEGGGVRRSITSTLDFLEAVALAVNTEAADEEMTRRYFRGAILNYGAKFDPWIRHRRDQTGQSRLYEELLTLAARWRD